MKKSALSIIAILKGIRAKAPLLLICAAIVSISYVSLWRHYLDPWVTTRSDLIYKIESKILDFKFRLRGPKQATGQIGILAVDEKAVTKFGDWPFSRKFYGQALLNLKKHGVKLVGFDAIFSDNQITRLSDVKTQINEIAQLALQRNKKNLAVTSAVKNINQWMDRSPGDVSFGEAVKGAGNILLGFFYFGSKREAISNLGSDSSKYFIGFEQMANSAIAYDAPAGMTLEQFPTLARAYGIKSNIPVIAQGADKFAFYSNDADDDAINRWVTLMANVNGSLMPSLGLKAAAEHMNRDIVVFFNSHGVDTISLVSREDQSNALEISTDPHGAGRLLVNHRGPSGAFKHYSLADAYYDTFNPQQLKELKGITLLLGGTATGTQDVRPNVFDPGIDGVENHAAAADNLIAGDFLRRDLKFFEIEKRIVVIIGILFAPLMIWGSSLLSGFAVVSFLAGYWYFDWTFWFLKGTWAYLAVPSVEVATMFIATTFYKYVTEEREKKQVKGAFQHYLSPAVIDQLLDDPSSMALGGVRREITVFFSDVRDFTNISESLTPEKLCEFMNDYFTPMTSIILESGGTLDKYIGDAIMAFWGAPIALPNHADRAANACLKMMFALDRLHEEFPKKNFRKPDIGIGLNSTMASVGNMGSHTRFSYTAMGDGVNLGSRLESLTKEYGIKIMVSEFTAAKLTPGAFFLRDLDDIRVKGKDVPVKVFELMRPDYVGNEDHLKNLIGEFELGRKSYRAMDWNQSEKHFRNCLAIKTDDGPTKKFLSRMEEFKINPPGDNWDGVYVFKHK